jgi:hypothetical protein
VGDQRRAGADHLRRAAVVVLQRYPVQRGVGGVEIDHAMHARAPPAVERLILVADHEQLVVRRGEHPHQQLVRRLDVLYSSTST